MEIIKILGHQIEFESESEEEKKENEKEKTKKNNKFQKRFYRDSDNKKLGGVAAGLAAYFGKDVTIVRVILLVCALIPFLSGIVIPFYFITWLIAPEALLCTKIGNARRSSNIDNLKSQFLTIKTLPNQ
jgi:phage shock protein PspC (stress-responsive transcriptional regulator)